MGGRGRLGGGSACREAGSRTARAPLAAEAPNRAGPPDRGGVNYGVTARNSTFTSQNGLANNRRLTKILGTSRAKRLPNAADGHGILENLRIVQNARFSRGAAGPHAAGAAWQAVRLNCQRAFGRKPDPAAGDPPTATAVVCPPRGCCRDGASARPAARFAMAAGAPQCSRVPIVPGDGAALVRYFWANFADPDTPAGSGGS